MQKLNWGILGTGRIAGIFARGIEASASGKLAAVGSRTQAKADKFGDEFHVPRRHASYEALLADPGVQAVYIATPHPMHAEWSIKAAEAGKHILCEKPMTINHAEAMAVIEAAVRHDVFFMEAFMYRCSPQTVKLVELIREKVIGEIRIIQASFSFQSGYNLQSRLLSNQLAGGGLLDVGCYCTSIAGLIAGAATGKEFAEPLEVRAVGHIGAESRVDEYTVASLKFPGGILAQLVTGVQVNCENVVRIFGSEGSIYIPSPWGPAKEGGTSKIIVQKNGEKEPREILIEIPVKLYALEADTVAAGIGRRQATWPAMTWNDSLSNMRMLDKWRQAIGLQYDSEKPAAQIHTVHRRPLAPRAGHKMKYGRIAGIDKPISRLVMGADQGTIAQASVTFDDFFEHGGNFFDTAYIYGGGSHEKLLGHWIKNRAIREKVVVLGKGAHSPFCTPKDLSRQLLESLQRMQLDHVDIYMLHRDNVQVPVAEFIDVLNEHRSAGRMRVFGGSNWTLERIDEGNAYAKSKGLQGFSAVSNNFSLARMIEPPWGGCLSASDAKSRAWFEKNQMPLIPWSSQARGFFTERSHPDNKSDEELVRCWYSDDNFRRKERVAELAKKRGVLPINVALAYVLAQPFPTFPIFGPNSLAETRTCLPALDLELSADERKWLNLEN